MRPEILKEAVQVDQELCRYCDAPVEITRDVHGMPEQLDGFGRISCDDCYESRAWIGAQLDVPADWEIDR